MRSCARAISRRFELSASRNGHSNAALRRRCFNSRNVVDTSPCRLCLRPAWPACPAPPASPTDRAGDGWDPPTTKQRKHSVALKDKRGPDSNPDPFFHSSSNRRGRARYLVLRDTPSTTARFCTDDGVRFSIFAIFSRPNFLRARDLSSRTSAAVQGARCFVGAFAIPNFPFLVESRFKASGSSESSLSASRPTAS